jgi:hypothetical protein
MNSIITLITDENEEVDLRDLPRNIRKSTERLLHMLSGQKSQYEQT